LYRDISLYTLSRQHEEFILCVLKNKIERRSFYRIKKEIKQLKLDKAIYKQLDLFKEIKEKYFTEIEHLRKAG
jgi:hypothetical protein